MISFIKKKRNRKIKYSIDPDEIFLDSKNLENFDQQQFEGRIEKQIPKRTIVFLGAFFLLIAISFTFRLSVLQIKKGEAYLTRSENNTLEKTIIFGDRGIIYDRNKIELAWNEKELGFSESEDKEDFVTQVPLRKYKTPGFAHVLGYVNYPSKDSSGNFWQTEFIGKDGLEKTYNEQLKGENGSKILEIDALRNIHSENIINLPKKSEGIITALDARIQAEFFSLIKDFADRYSFSGGAGVIMNIHNGEILTSVSFPEYDPEILSLGKNRDIINGYLNDKRNILIDRTISGLYTPGSIVKPIFALGALKEGIISPDKKILSTGSIAIPNPYFPGQETVFKDWKAHGWTDMKQAIAVSSDVYFYSIGGGFEDQKGLGISRIEKYAKLFAIGEKTNVDLPDERYGNIPNPEWKAKNFNGDIWRVGDTYNTAIGQYGFQLTPLEICRAIGAIANYGKLVTPHLLLNDFQEEEIRQIDISKEDFDIVHEGMRQAVSYGTAVSLNVPYVQIAAKTGTAQIGVAKNRVNSWSVGFFPYENPKYSFVILMESGPSNGTVGASNVMRGLFDWMSIHSPEYFQ